jgi:hypothetical protein
MSIEQWWNAVTGSHAGLGIINVSKFISYTRIRINLSVGAEGNP